MPCAARLEIAGEGGGGATQAGAETGAAPAGRPEAGAALEAFLDQAALPAGFVEAQVGVYRALCRDLGGRLKALALAGPDGEMYLSDALDGDEREALQKACRRRGVGPGGGSLALRLPADLGGGAGTFTLWVTARYLAARGEDGGSRLWK
jgi:hypothetical protein